MIKNEPVRAREVSDRLVAPCHVVNDRQITGPLRAERASIRRSSAEF